MTLYENDFNEQSTQKHVHQFEKLKSKSVAVCHCGKFRFTKWALGNLGVIEEIRPFAVFNGIQKGFKEIKDFPIYTVFWEGHKLDGSTVTRETLEEIGVTDIRGTK